MTRSGHADPPLQADPEMMNSADDTRERIGLDTVLLTLLASSLLRMLWFALVLIMPRTTTGLLLFVVVLASAGVVLLHWCLSWFGWTISLRAALVARALPGLTAVAIAATVGFRASLSALLVLVALEFLLGVVIVRAAARRVEGWIEPIAESYAEDTRPLSAAWFDSEDGYTEDLAGLVRAARTTARS